MTDHPLSPLRIVVAGATGRMGRMLIEAVEQSGKYLISKGFASGRQARAKA